MSKTLMYSSLFIDFVCPVLAKKHYPIDICGIVGIYGGQGQSSHSFNS